MASGNEPTLEDDEARLHEFAMQLVDAIEPVLGPWLIGLVGSRAPELAARDEIAAALSAHAGEVAHELRDVLQQDIADQKVGPLEVLRRSVRVATAVLTATEVPAEQRDEFARTNFPEDVYDLTPASFAAIHPSLHEPGLMWGAAKAHVHLRRRREAAG